tara:strand:- start:1239 stop:1415 length:177 start_codon:yes stop_codon:yes gene_type:complete
VVAHQDRSAKIRHVKPAHVQPDRKDVELAAHSNNVRLTVRGGKPSKSAKLQREVFAQM